MSRARVLMRGLAALVALAALAVGVPVALWVVVGWPLPHHLPSLAGLAGDLHQPISPGFWPKAFAAGAWAAWAWAIASLAAEAAVQAARHEPRCRRDGRPTWSARLLLPVIALATLAAPGASGRSPGPITPAVALIGTHPASALHALTTATAAAAPLASPGLATHPGLPTYVVRPGDTLWSIASSHLGAGQRWREIWALNDNRPEPTGTFENPNWIYPGWIITLPAGAAGPGLRRPPDPQPPIPASGATSARASAGTAPASSGPTASAPQAVAPPSIAAPPVPERRSGPPPASPAQRAERSTAPGSHEGAEPAWVELASGSQVGGAFAAGVLAALALGRLRRRRAYRPSAPAPGLHLGLSDVTPTVGELGRRARIEAGSDGAAPPSSSVAPVLAGRGAARLDPALIEAGRSGSGVVRLRLTDWGGLALVGECAETVARAWLAALLTRAGPYGAQVLGSAEILCRLLPGAAPAPGACATADVEETLAYAEAELLSRSRRLADAEAPDAATYRRANPEDPLPALVLVAGTVPADLAGRWQAMLEAGPDLDIAALVVTAAEPPPALAGAWVRLDGGGRVLQAHPDALGDELTGARLFRLDTTEAADLLGPVIEAQRGTDSGTGLGDAGPSEPDLPAAAGLTPEAENEPDGQREVHESQATSAGRAPAGGRTGPDGGPAAAAPLDAPPGVVPPQSSQATSPPPLLVRLLGPYRITAWGEEVRSGLRASSRELLAWYLLHPEGASAEAALEDLDPGIDPDKVSDRFWTALGNLRTRLHGPHKRQGVEVLVKSGDAYRPHSDALEVDVWDFEHALAQAARATNPTEVAMALQVAVEAYRGDLLEGTGWLWAEATREDLHRRALDAHLRLAEVREQSGELERAADVLERAVALDPLAEETYRRLMDTQARLGRHDAARRAWGRLQGRLAELDLEPEAATISLARRVHDANGSTSPSRQPQPRTALAAKPVPPAGPASAGNRRGRP